MIKAGIDQDAIIKMFSEGTAKQGEALRSAEVNRGRLQHVDPQHWRTTHGKDGEHGDGE